MEHYYEVLWKSATDNNKELMLKILPQIENINHFNNMGWNAIILAAFNHSMDALEILIQNGADVNSTNINGTSVFMYAKTKCFGTNDFKILDFLLEHGADINHRDKKLGWTVLRYVQDVGDNQLENYLTAKGAII